MIDFVIIGAQKSASTYVHRIIELSDEVYIPRGEVRSFEDPHYHSGGAEKIRKICEAGQGKIVGIKRPDYLGKGEVPQRIYEHNKDAKLILVLRDPIERFQSAYYHYVKLGFAPVEDINKVVPAIVSGRYQERYRKLAEILPYGKYFECLSRYREYFSRESILIIEKNDLRDREAITSKLETFLGTRMDKEKDIPFWSSNQGVYNERRLKFLRLRNKLCYRYNAANTIRWRRKNPLSTLVNSGFYAADRLVLVGLLGNKKPLLDDENRAILTEYYRDDQALFAEEYLRHDKDSALHRCA